MTADETAALLCNWEEAVANMLRKILAGSQMPGVTAVSAQTDTHDAARGKPEGARSHRREKAMATAVAFAGRSVTCQPAAAGIQAHAGHEGGGQTDCLGKREEWPAGREMGGALGRSGAGQGVFAEERGAGYHICARRLRNEFCWCRQTPALSIEWVVDVTGRGRSVGRLSMVLALALDGYLPAFAGGLTVQCRFHGLVERQEGGDPADAHQDDAGGRSTHRLLFSSIVIAD